MKRLFAAILFTIVLFTGAKAQDYEPLVQEGVEWGYYSHELALDEDKKPYLMEWTYRITLQGDEVKNGKTYKRVYRYDSCTFGGDDTVLLGWIREENKQVFFLRNSELELTKFPQYSYDQGRILMFGDETETMIYDFSLNKIGDEFIRYDGYISVVTEIKEVELLGKKKRILSFDSYTNSAEGWGGYTSVRGDLVFPFTLITTCMVCVKTEFNYYKNKDGVIEYNRPQNLNVDPCLGSVSSIQEDKIKITHKDGFLCVDSSEDYHFCMIELVNASGQCVLKKMVDNLDNHQIPTTRLASGVYILSIATDNGNVTSKLIIN